MIELLGIIPKHLALKGKYSREFFNRRGELLHIQNLKSWPMREVLMEKYRFSEADAIELTEFLEPMLSFNPSKRATPQQSLEHPFLHGVRYQEGLHKSNESSAATTPVEVDNI
jgi:serine/threonine protein kinase